MSKVSFVTEEIFISCINSSSELKPWIFALNKPALELKMIRLFCEKAAVAEKNRTKIYLKIILKVIDNI